MLKIFGYWIVFPSWDISRRVLETDQASYYKLIMEGILTVPTLQKEILTVPTVPTVTAMPPVVPALQPATVPTNLGWVYCDLMVCSFIYEKYLAY